MNSNLLKARSLVFAFLVVCFCAAPLCGEEITYEKQVRPILKTHCFHCHGEGGELQGELDLRLLRLITQGGESGAAIVAGKPEQSVLLQRLREGDMPPESVELRPSDDEIATIERWIAKGAVASRPEPADLNPDNYITEEERAHWAFQPVERRRPPDIGSSTRARTPVDRFIIAELTANHLTISDDADPRTLVRRVYFDLLGLPPSPAEVEAFVNDSSPDAYERMVDRVLNSAHYGERWGRHWLDVAGYADSEGYTEDDPRRPDAYKYRDYVIRAFNEDKPFDQFIIEQLAGDELLPRPLENLTPQQAEKLIATGFLRMAPDGSGSRGVEQDVARNDVMAKTIEIVSTSLLGLTVACAQCHNHRYDPISQEDYYAIRAIFEPALDWKNWQTPAKRRLSLYTDADRKQAAQVEAEAKAVLAQRTKLEAEHIEAVFQRELGKLEEALRDPLTAARNAPASDRTTEQKQLLKKYPSLSVSAKSLYLYDKKAADELKKMADKANAIRKKKPKEEFVRAAWEPTDKEPPQTYLFHRGDHEQPKQTVKPRELTVLTSAKPIEIPAKDDALPSSGRRLAYARWLTSGEHPLVARVIVNRIWLHHFGRGLVPTAGDFGALGVEPSHVELLDWLASEFVAGGWSVKQMHRVIMASTTYRQRSLHHAKGDSVDADNTLYWRMPVRRIEAEVLRDAALAVSGELNRKAFGPAVPVMADRVGQFVIGKENLNAGRPGAVIPMNGEEFRRSVYIESRRSRPLSVLAPFDLPRMEPNCTSRNASTVSPQSLMLMNSTFAVTRAKSFAERIQREAGDDASAQIELAWQLAYSASPSAEELAGAQTFLEEQTKTFSANTNEKNMGPTTEALASFCHALLSSNRFLYID